MIKKMQFKIFMIIFSLISIILIVGVIYNRYTSYKLTIKNIMTYVEKSIEDDKENKNVYRFRIKDSEIKYGNSEDENLKRIAIKAFERNNDFGIIENYIYKNSNFSNERKRKCYCAN